MTGTTPLTRNVAEEVPENIDELVAAERAALAALRTDAAAWTKLTGALVGIFGTAAFVGGLPTFEDLDSVQKLIAKILTVAALIVLMLATISGAIAERNAPQELPAMSPNDLQRHLANKKPKVKRWILTTKILGFLGVLVIIGGSLWFVFDEPTKETSPPKVLAVTPEGVVCGPLSGEGTNLRVNDVSLDDATQIVVVEGCD